MLDIQIRDGLIIDGTGAPGHRGCLDIHRGRIVGMGTECSEARSVINAAGLCVAPGFIDAHSHADLALMDEAQSAATLSQGITTAVVGNCGFSVFPVGRGRRAEVLRYGAGIFGTLRGAQQLETDDFQAYAASVEKEGANINAVALVGQGTLHSALFGYESKELSDAELQGMTETLAVQLDQGAAGLSLGLIYPPGSYTQRRELLRLAQVVAERGKVMSVHLRSEGETLLQSMDEMLRIADETGVHIHFSHHKVMGMSSWGKSAQSLEKIHIMRQWGLHVTLDAYPYEAGCSTAMALLPPWIMQSGFAAAMRMLGEEGVYERAHADIENGLDGWENLAGSCGWDRLVVTATGSGSTQYIGKTFAEIAAEQKQDPLRCLMTMLAEEQGNVNVAIFGMDPDEVDRIICCPETLIGSDSLFSEGASHPRAAGALPRVLRKYVREQNRLPLEEAIAKMTLKTANCFSIRERGRLKAGYAADVTVFDAQRIADTADYAHPQRKSVGIAHVILNGEHVWNGQEMIGKSAGRVLPV